MGKYNINRIEKLLFENVFAIVILFDREGKVIDWNSMARKQLGYEGELETVNIADIFRREFFMTGKGIIYTERKNGNPVAYRKNQTCFPVKLCVIMENKEEQVGICIAID
ncbi:MAG: PAS domain S-box protein, partial [Acetivibrio sp.]